MSNAESDSVADWLCAAEDAAEELASIPHDGGVCGPPVPDDGRPSGPPSSMPANGPPPVRAERNPSRVDDDDDAHDGRGTESQPTQGRRTEDAGSRGRSSNAPPSSCSTSRSASDEDGDASVSGNSYTFSDTSLVLDGPCLQQSQSQVVSFFREQVLHDEPDIPSRSLAGKIGAIRRQVCKANWCEVQRIARVKLRGKFLRRWQLFEYEATHERRRRRIRDPQA